MDRWLLPFVRDSALWPILLVLMGHAAAFIAPALLIAIRDRGFAGQAALVLLVFLTYGVVSYDVRRFRRPAALTGVVAGTWLMSALMAWAADRWGLF